jgi:predicted transcriptional regulator
MRDIRMSTKKDFNNKCFSPNWLEVDLSDAESREDIINKEVSLESQRRKDLNTLLKELDEIKKSIEKAVEKQHRLANLAGFYTGEFAQ